MFTARYQKTKKVPYIRHPSYENLFVLPYISCRLVFAELAARAIKEGQFDLLAVDLPYFMENDNWLDTPIDSFPYASSLIIKTSKKAYKTFNFTPNDAASISVYQARRMQGEASTIEYECLDDSNLINYPELFFEKGAMEFAFPDDYFALTDGVESYFSRVYVTLDTLWETFTAEQKLYWNYRAAVVANRLNECLKRGKKTLFVCNYVLWWIVNKKLQSGNFEAKNIVFKPWRDRKALLLFRNPYFFWIKGVLDDYPAVVHRFFNDLDRDNADSFDKIQTLNQILGDVFEKFKAEKPEKVSIRRLLIFRQYLRVRLGLNCRITPDLPRFLYDSAVSCAGKSFARNILGKLLKYPLPDELYEQVLTISEGKVEVSDKNFELPHIFLELLLNSDGSACGWESSGDCQSDEGQREHLVAQVHPFVKKAEKKHLHSTGGVRWALKQEYLIHAQANRLVHRIAMTASREYQSVKSWGSTGDAIDWKATIRSRGAGDNAIYIKKSRKNNPLKLDLNAFVPTVFILEECDDSGRCESVHDSNITQRYIELKNEALITQEFPNPDYVYSIFSLKTFKGRLCGGHITKDSVSAILFLCTHPWMGPDRYERIMARPERFHCRVMPEGDEELRPFKYPDKLVACGVKYAEKMVVVVSKDNWKPGPDILAFAKQKNVRIIQVSLSSISPELIKKLRHMHFISTSLKKNPYQEDILQRYLPDLFGGSGLHS